MSIRLSPGQSAVRDAFTRFGPMPDAALVPLLQHVSGDRQSSSSIRSRRAELARLGVVRATPDTVRTSSGRTARVFEVIA